MEFKAAGVIGYTIQELEAIKPQFGWKIKANFEWEVSTFADIYGKIELQMTDHDHDHVE